MDRDGLTSFVLGVGVGVGLGLIFAPKSGEETRELLKGFAIERQSLATEPAFTVHKSAADEGANIFFGEGFEHQDAGTREQWRDNFK